MRVVMPLFDFQYHDDEDFAFSDGRLSIRSFHNAEPLYEREIFSKQDRDYMGQASKALVAEYPTLDNYKADVSLLLVSFRILGDHRAPFIKYRLSENEDFCSRLEETQTHIPLPERLYNVYSSKDFPSIDAAYMTLRQAEPISVRLKNALFFIYRAFNSYHWIDSFLFHMNALEALFSRDEGGSATRDICTHVSGLLNEPSTWSYQTIKDLYGIRSQITHGRFEANYEPMDNLRRLEKMECLTKACFRDLIAQNAFQHFATPDARTRFLTQLADASRNAPTVEQI